MYMYTVQANMYLPMKSTMFVNINPAWRNHFLKKTKLCNQVNIYST